MNKKDHPLWLKIALRLPLGWKRKIRHALQMAEYFSNNLVLENEHEILMLIENTEKPDFAEFDRQLDLAEKAWGDHDELFARMATMNYPTTKDGWVS